MDNPLDGMLSKYKKMINPQQHNESDSLKEGGSNVISFLKKYSNTLKMIFFLTQYPL